MVVVYLYAALVGHLSSDDVAPWDVAPMASRMHAC